MISKKNIDGGKAFDWGLTSADYARYRDIYPPAFYEKIMELGLCTAGQRVLDLGTGTGVLPRNLYSHGASFVGADISAEQIVEARRLSAEKNMEIEYIVSPAEELDFPVNSFDAVTACQCFQYFDVDVLLPRLKRMLKPGGRLLIAFMAWLPGESDIARRSEELVLRYSPSWQGAGMRRGSAAKPDWADRHGFTLQNGLQFDAEVSFTKESWNGRMRACRGVGASLSPEEVHRFEREHLAMLGEYAPATFQILHHTTMVVLENQK